MGVAAAQSADLQNLLLNERLPAQLNNIAPIRFWLTIVALEATGVNSMYGPPNSIELARELRRIVDGDAIVSRA